MNDPCLEGQKKIAQRFKQYIKENYPSLGDITEIEWDKYDDSFLKKFAVHIDKKRIVMKGIDPDTFRWFGGDGPESARIELLEQKANELIKKLK